MGINTSYIYIVTLHQPNIKWGRSRTEQPKMNTTSSGVNTISKMGYEIVEYNVTLASHFMNKLILCFSWNHFNLNELETIPLTKL